MTDTAIPAVDAFLRQYESADASGSPQPGLPAAATEVQQWVQAHPAAALHLVQEAQAAQAQLQAVRRERLRDERARRMGVPAGPSQEELRRQSQAWDKLLGTRNGHRVQAAGGGATGAGASSPAAARRPSFEDVGLRFMEAHAGKAWLALGVVAAIVVAVR